jgi:hypothetical protein
MEDSRSQWKLPVTNESELDAVTFTAWRARKVLAKQQMLIKYVNAIKNIISE